MNYKNPIIRGFNPDPSVCRCGDDYYLVTSTFEYFPGIPVYHSTDLVNWEMIGHCIDREGQLPMDEANVSGGIWAPTIRFYDGKFYVTATFSGKGNFIVSSDNPAGGYSDPVWVEQDGIDPSMYFEDGRMYYCANDCGSRGGNGEGISVAEVDVNTGRVIGEIKRVWSGTGGGWLEAPHIYRIGGRYYLIAAEGGTSQGHTSVAASCDTLMGDYTACDFNPILTNRNDTTKRAMCCGHADLTQDKDGNLFLVHLGTRGAIGTRTNLGRETFLTPVTLENGGFKPTTARIDVTAPGDAVQREKRGFYADFTAAEWEKEWLFVRRRTGCTRGGGTLEMAPSRDALTDDCGTPTFAAIRQPDFDCRLTVTLKFDPCEDGDEAGIAAYLTPKFMYKMCKKRVNGADYVTVEKIADDFYEMPYREKAPSGELTLTIRADREKYTFYIDGGDGEKRVGAASTRFLSCETADKCFTGTLLGVYAHCESETNARAKIIKFGAEI